MPKPLPEGVKVTKCPTMPAIGYQPSNVIKDPSYGIGSVLEMSDENTVDENATIKEIDTIRSDGTIVPSNAKTGEFSIKRRLRKLNG